jgi:type IVB pilus formation R64 PilN family outer membrane protein
LARVWVSRCLWLLAALALALGGCALTRDDINRAVKGTDTKIAANLSQSRQPPPAVAVRNGNWLAGRETPLEAPSAPEIRQRILLGSAMPASLREIAQRIAQLTRIPVELEPDLQTPGTPAGGTTRSAGAAPALPSLPPIQGLAGASAALPALPAPAAGLGTAGLSGDDDSATARIAYSHDGPLNELLDQVAARFGVAWEYKGGRISISRTITRTFTLYLPAGTRTMEAEVGGKAVGQDKAGTAISTGTGGSNLGGGLSGASNDSNVGQNVKAEATLDPWKEVEGAVRRLLSVSGKFAVSPSAGDIVVTDTPAGVKRVADFIEQKNASLARQVAIQVDVLSVEVDDGENFEVQWNLVFKNSLLAMGFITPDTITSATSTLAMQIVRPSSDFNGSQAIVKALSTALNGRLVQSTVATTLNNQPAPVQVTRTDGYLKATATTVTGVTGTVSNTLLPGSITTGFQMTVTPRILDRDRLMVSYNIDLSRLLGFTNASVGSGDNKATIQIPNFERRAFIQAVTVKAGDTLVLGGFEQAEDSANLAGPVVPENALFGSRTLSKKRTRLVVLITPVLVGNGAV